jgi:hypothetical protein
MGDNIHYVIFMNMKEIARRDRLVEEIHHIKGLIQRQVTNRSTEIATYLKTQIYNQCRRKYFSNNLKEINGKF